ncbi:MAG: hypothetical protein QM754_02340 [Tepidisphaeraceae bacterium]
MLSKMGVAIGRVSLSVIATILFLLLAIELTNAQHDWNASNPTGGHYLSNLWTGISRAVNDAGFWAVIAGGTVGIFVMLVTVEPGVVPIGQQSGLTISVLIGLTGVVLAMLPVAGVRDAFHDVTYFVSRGLNLLGIAVAMCFWPIGVSYVRGLVRDFDARQAGDAHPAHLHDASLLASAVIAGPLTAAVAFALWRIVNGAFDGVPVNAAFILDLFAGEGVIALASIPGLLLHLHLLQSVRGTLRFRPRWLRLARYFGLVFFFGIPLTAPLMRTHYSRPVDAC